MKPTTEPLLDALLEETAPPEFRAALMAETLRSARRRTRARRFRLALGLVALAGIFALIFQETRGPQIASKPLRPSAARVAASSPPSPVRIVRSEPGPVAMVASSDSRLTEVETTEADRPAEINDRQLFALLAGKPVALIHRGKDQAELILLNPKDENGFAVQ